MTLPIITSEKILEYGDFFEIPSCSIEKQGISESVNWLTNKFNQLGANKVETWGDYGDFPVIVAEFKGKSNQTLLIYNHYDVQPIGNKEAWDTEPFIPTIQDGKLFCRGASDCKGEIVARLMMIEYFQKYGGLPCNVTFLIEGEEEIGSPNLKKYIRKYQSVLNADVCLWECGWKNEKEQLEISCGVKGLLSFDLEVKTAAQPVHSSYANIVQNAGWQLTQCLASLKNSQNDILVEDFYADVEPLSNEVEQAIKKLAFEDIKFRQNLGLTSELIGEDYQKELLTEPTLNISQIRVGEKLTTSVGKIYGKSNYQLLPNFAGGGPMAIFGTLIGAPIVAVGSSYSESNVHAPNENIRLTDLEQNIHCLIDWIGSFNE